jgi:hypothetical protein
MLKSLLTSFVFVLLATQAVGDEADLIEFLKDELTNIREEIEAREAAPNDAWYLGSEKADYQEDIDQILDMALGLVVPVTFEIWVEQIEEIRVARTEAETLRAELLLDRLQAKTSKGVGMVANLLGREYESGSLEDIDLKLVNLDAAIAQLEDDQEMVTNGFADEMKELYEVTLTNAQSKAILYSVNGGLLIEATVVLNAIGNVENRLAELMKEEIGPDASRTYIGVASATRLIHVRMLQRHLMAYDGEWLPRLAAIRTKTQDLLAQTGRDAAEANQESVRQTYANNIEIQERTLKVVDRYEAMLKRRREITADALIMAEERASAAVNTLMTFETAASLSSVITEATSDYEAVMAVNLPELEQLDPDEFEELRDISGQLGS